MFKNPTSIYQYFLPQLPLCDESNFLSLLHSNIIGTINIVLSHKDGIKYLRNICVTLLLLNKNMRESKRKLCIALTLSRGVWLCTIRGLVFPLLSYIPKLLYFYMIHIFPIFCTAHIYSFFSTFSLLSKYSPFPITGV